MLANQLITNYPTVDPDDSIFTTLQLMDDFNILHIPVVDNNKFLGLISKDELLDADENAAVKSLTSALLPKAVKDTDHFLLALKLSSENALSVVPVVNSSFEWVGAISAAELLKSLTIFTGAEQPGALIVLEMERKSYSFGEISRLIETNDAYITQFNTQPEPATGLLIVTIKINKAEVSDIISTLQRYEYSIRYFFGEEQYENELRLNYENLMSYLKF